MTIETKSIVSFQLSMEHLKARLAIMEHRQIVMYNMLRKILNQEKTIMADLTTLLAETTENNDLVTSVTMLIEGHIKHEADLQAQIDAAPKVTVSDEAALAALGAELDKTKAALLALNAAASGTPAAPAAPTV